MTSKKMTAALICGMLGCLCFGGGDWLMMYGDASYDMIIWFGIMLVYELKTKKGGCVM